MSNTGGLFRDIGCQYGMTDLQRERAAQYSAGYLRGQSDAWDGTLADVKAAGEQYANGYRAGHKWGTDHPAVYRAERFACVCGAEFRAEWERDDHTGRNGCLQVRTS